MAYFIAIEGLDGAGKTTQLQLLTQHLRDAGKVVCQTAEPTQGPYGKKLRSLFFDRQNLTPKQEVTLFVEDRIWHLQNTIHPALARNEIVITDRYYYSNFVYQASAEYSVETLRALNKTFIQPDLVLLLDLPPEVSYSRIIENREGANDFESLENLTRVRDAFHALQDTEIVYIDASGTINETWQNILLALPRELER